jgi:hypothetical protein
MGVQMLCIDNDDVRQAIVKDNHGYHIKTVPCVFLFHSNGRLEKYEGSDAFTWLRKAREILEATILQQQASQPQQTPIQFQAPPQQQAAQAPPPPPQQTPIQQLPTVASKQQSQPFYEEPQPLPFETPYEKVNNDPLDITPIEENGIQTVSQNLPPQQNTEDIMQQEMDLRRASEQIMTRKQDNIKEIAQMMQRQRENDDDNLERPALYPKDKI